MRRAHRKQRGMTLIEAVIALVILVTGLAALFGLVNNVQNANQSLAFQNNALDVLARLSAQIRDARCDYPADTDPVTVGDLVADSGLLGPAAPNNVWVGAGGPVDVQTAINFVGNSDLPVPNPLRDYSPPIQVDYRVINESAPSPAPPTFRVDIRVRQLTRDSVGLAGGTNQDDVALTDGYWIRVFPVQKVCSPRIDIQGRGEY